MFLLVNLQPERAFCPKLPFLSHFKKRCFLENNIYMIERSVYGV